MGMCFWFAATRDPLRLRRYQRREGGLPKNGRQYKWQHTKIFKIFKISEIGLKYITKNHAQVGIWMEGSNYRNLGRGSNCYRFFF